MTERSNRMPFERVMEETGFFRGGRPTPHVKLIADLKSKVDTSSKFRAVIDPGQIGADAIYETAGAPCVYFKHLAHDVPDQTVLAPLHRLAWNQGLSPMLWVSTPSKILLYNCYSKPGPDDSTSPDQHILKTFETTSQGLRELNELAGRERLDAGTFWRSEPARAINRDQRVDESLGKDLVELGLRLLGEGLTPPVAHALVGQAILATYLYKRGILVPTFMREQLRLGSLSEVLSEIQPARKLFQWLAKTFGGDLVKPALHAGPRAISSRHLQIIADFVGDVDSTTLGARPYQFDVIPVELISSVYEKLAHVYNPRGARALSAHYTPFNLVDLVLSEVFESLQSNARVLDLACGSGVFLVESLRRLVAAKVTGDSKALTRRLVRDTLYRQVFGVDVSAEAIRLASLSLYLAAIDLDPDPRGPDVAFRSLVGSSLFVADSFDLRAPFNHVSEFAGRQFDAVVGNPPWTRLQRERNTGASSSGSSRSRQVPLYLEYCERRVLPTARGNPDHAFVWRARDFTTRGATVGLVLHAKPFFSHAPRALAAKRRFLTEFTPRVLINLSNLREEHLFPATKAPALIFVARAQSAPENCRFAYATASHGESFRHRGAIDIGSDDIQVLSSRLAATDQDVLKVAAWGGPRDANLVAKLLHQFPGLGRYADEMGWARAQGYQSVKGLRQASFLTGNPSLDGVTFKPFFVDVSILPRLARVGFHRVRDRRIYKGPTVIAVRNVTKQNLFCAALSDVDVAFSESFYGIAPASDLETARCLDAILNSRVANYFIFMTASVWGVERDEVRASDLWRLPIPRLVDSGVARKGVLNALDAIEDDIKIQRHPSPTSRALLETAVFDLYGLKETERILINDAVDVTIDRRMRGVISHAYKTPSYDWLVGYAEALISVIQPYLHLPPAHALVADVLMTPGAPLQAIKFSMIPAPARRPVVIERATAGLDAVLREIAELLPQKLTANVYAHRVLRIYTGSAFYAVKPAQRLYWSRSSGLRDADAILGEHLGSPGVTP